MHYTQQKCASKLHHCTQIRPIKNKKACKDDDILYGDGMKILNKFINLLILLFFIIILIFLSFFLHLPCSTMKFTCLDVTINNGLTRTIAHSGSERVNYTSF